MYEDSPVIFSVAYNTIRLEEVIDFLDEVESGSNLTKHQQAFHKKTKVRDLAITTLLLGTGIRVSECVGLDIADVDFMNDRINIVRKGGFESFVYYGEEVRQALLDYMEEREEITETRRHDDLLHILSGIDLCYS